MEFVLLALLVAILGFLFYINKRLEEVVKEVRIPTIKRASDLPDLKARLKTLPRPEGAPAPRSESPRPAGSENRGERNDRGPREGRPDRGPREGRPDRGDRNDRGPRDGNRERSDRGPRDGNRDRGDRGPREGRPERNDRGERRDNREARPATEQAAESTAPAAEVVTGTEASAPAPVQQQVGGRRPLTPVGSAPAASSFASAPEPDVLAAASLAQEAPEAPIRHGRRQLPKARPNLDDVQIEEEKPAA